MPKAYSLGVSTSPFLIICRQKIFSCSGVLTASHYHQMLCSGHAKILESGFRDAFGVQSFLHALGELVAKQGVSIIVELPCEHLSSPEHD